MDIKQIKTGVLQENTYIISKNNKCIVIDPGNEVNKINSYLNDKLLKVEAILLTHGHFDHIGAVKELCQLEKCKVYASMYEKDILENSKNNGALRYTHRDLNLSDIDITYYEEEVIIKINDFNVEVIFSPGHTKGSVCYLIGDALFSGDTLFKGTCGRTDLYSGNKQDMRNSLKYLFTLNDDINVFPGHGDVTTIKQEKQNYKF